MQALIVLAHPEPQSFNAQLAQVTRDTLEGQGHAVEISDLCAQGFDPVEGPGHFPSRRRPAFFEAQGEQRHAADSDRLPDQVAAEIAKLERADLVVLQYPLWWFGLPAILKGWMDRVFVYGKLYTGSMRFDRGIFRGKRALVSVTAGAPASTHGPDGRSGDIDLILWPTLFSLHYLGYSVLPAFVAGGVEGSLAYSPPEEVKRRLEGHKAALRAHLEGLDTHVPLPFNGWDDWDESGRLKPDAPSHSPFIRHLEKES